MKKQIKRKIYFLSKAQMKPIEVVQYETGVQLVFEVQDIELDTSATATLFVRKPSGKFVFQEDNISLTGNTVVIDLHNQAITEYGHPFFQIKFKKDEEVISTYSGMLTVEKSLDDSGAEESKTVLAAFEELTDEQIARIEEATRSQIDLMKAEVEAKGETVLATIPDEYTEMYNRVNTLFNSVANAIKGTVSGPVVRVDDVSPVEHFPVVNVHGKNLFDISKITDATHIVNNGDGTLSVTSVTDSYSAATGKTLRELAPSLKAGEAYTLTALTDVTSNVRKKMYLSHSKANRSWMFGETIMLDDIHLDSRVYFYANDKENVTTISNIQIEKGEAATEYTPYIDPTTVTVTRCGKNILGYADDFSITQDGLTIEYDANEQIFTINGTPEKASFPINFGGHLFDKFSLSVGTDVALSIEHISGTLSAERMTNVFYLGNADSAGGGRNNWFSVPFPISGRKTNISTVTRKYLTHTWLYIGSEYDVTFNNYKFKVQLEIGNEATNYEKFKGVKYNPAADGTVDILTTSQTMSFLTDKSSVTIECEYNKDTGKVIDNLTKAVVALGGVV